jgi:predicted phage replisome organizer
MAENEIKWIKLYTAMFDDDKIKLIESLPEKDSILIIWIKLLTQAGKCNASGHLILNNKIPYTDEMLATVFNRPLNTVRLALNTFEEFGMIEFYDDMLKISDWEDTQNIEGMEKIREQNRLRKQKQRLNQKQIKLLQLDNCCYCGKKDEITIDHLIPLSRGGIDISENCVPSCLKCNMSKSNRDLDIFLNEKLSYSELYLNGVLSNEKIMKLVHFDSKKFTMFNESRDVTKIVTGSHAIDIDIDIDKDLKDIKDIGVLSFEDIWSLYPNKRGKGSIKPARIDILSKIGFEKIKIAIERYIKDVELRRIDFPDLSYKYGSTFFNSGYVDYLEDDFEFYKPLKTNAKVKANYEQRNYTKDQLDNLTNCEMEEF